MKREYTFVIFYFCLFTIALFAQQPAVEWVKRYPVNSPNQSQGRSIKTDSLGFIYVLADTGNSFGYIKYDSNGNILYTTSFWPGGYESGWGEYFDVSKNGDVCVTGSLYLTPNYYIFTAKYNSAGVLQWSKVFRTDIYNLVNDINIDKLGNVNVIGAAVINSQGYALLIHYNQFGDTIWTRYFNNNLNTASYRKITLDNLNNIYVEGNISNIGKCLISKYDINGNQLWFNTFTYDVSRSNLGRGISVDLLGNVYIIGTQAKPQSQYDAYLLKLNNSGQIQWDYPYPGYGTGNNSLWGPLITSDGNSVYYTASVHDTVATGYNIATIKVNSTGVFQWSRIYNGGLINGVNIPANIKFDRFENIYVVGTAYFATTGDDIVSLKYSPSGILNWSVKYSGVLINGGEYGADLILDSNSSLYVTGMSRKSNNSGYDAVTIKYDQTIGIVNNNNEIPVEFKLNQNYPNPFNASTILTYQLPIKSFIRLSIFDVSGKLVKVLVNRSQDAGNYSNIIEMNNFPSGIYFYKLEANNKMLQTKKMILIK